MSTGLQGEAQTPKNRPVWVSLTAVAFIAIGLLDIWRGATPLTTKPVQMAGDDLVIFAIGIAALLGGICALTGHNWARWLLTTWMALHVALSIRQPYVLLGHIVIFGLVLAALFHAAASAYFRQRDGQG
jgi:hypothetical protein